MRKLFSVGVVVTTALASFAAVLVAAPAHAATNTTVVLTFDDQWGSQTTSEALLESHGMLGTFFINSNRVGDGSNGNLSWTQLLSYQAAGHEIAGHTLDHIDLTTLSNAQVQTQVCDDRTAIMSHGITPTDFAYPDGSGYDSASIRTIIQNCGYSSARRADGLHNAAAPYAETSPPTDIWAIKTAQKMPDTSTTLAEIEGFVTGAETHGGGLVPIVFHDNLATLSPFLDWLQLRAASGTVTKTMTQALNQTPPPTDTTAPTSSISCNGSACSSGLYAPSMQVSLSATDNAGGSGVAAIRYTTDGSTPSATSTAYSAPFTLPSTKTVEYRAYDNSGNAETTKSQLIQIDATAPASTMKCNGAACSNTSYGAAVQVALSATDGAGSGVAQIRYTIDGSDPTPAGNVYSAPFTVSATTTVKYRAYDNTGNAETTNSQTVFFDTVAPVSSIACNGLPCSGWYRAPVHVSLSATDGAGSGVAAIRYTTDGADPTPASNVYSAPFTLSATTTVKDRASDNAGNEEATASMLVNIDTVAPVSTIACKGVACSSGWYRKPVQVSLSASDIGSGVAAIHFTTDGSNPTGASPVYTGPFVVSISRNVRYFAVDTAGNAGLIKTALVKVDTSGPVVALASPGVNALGAGTVTFSVKTTDARSGVTKVNFYIDGRLVSTDKKPGFSFRWNTTKASKKAHTLTAVVYDVAGNSTKKSITVHVH